MPDLFTDEFAEAKRKWEIAKTNYNEAVVLYEAIYSLLNQQHRILDETWKVFQNQQSLVVKKGKNPSVRNIKQLKET